MTSRTDKFPMQQGVRIPIGDAPITDVELGPLNGTRTLPAMYEAIGCDLVDRVGLTSDADLWVDDEGMLTEFPKLNERATALCIQAGRAAGATAIYGHALLTGIDRPTGATTTPPASAISLLAQTLANMHDVVRIANIRQNSASPAAWLSIQLQILPGIVVSPAAAVTVSTLEGIDRVLAGWGYERETEFSTVQKGHRMSKLRPVQQ